MEKTWLWDVKISEKEVREILKSPEHEKFIYYAALLLSRSNQPQQVFDNYFDQKTFVEYWNAIKRRMRENKWNEDRIIFWQEIYRFLLDKFKLQGVRQRHPAVEPTAGLQKEVGQSIKTLRVSSGMTQRELAQKAGVHQQVISKVEKGIANPSLRTIEKITQSLPGKAGIKIIDVPAYYITTSYPINRGK